MDATEHITIRPATVDDVPALAACGARFITHTHFAALAPDFTIESIAPILQNLIEGERSTVLVVERGGALIGGLAGVLGPLWFAPEVTLGVVFGWWVEREQRGAGAGRMLLQEFEQWSRERGAVAVSLSDLVSNVPDAVPELIDMLQRAGYTLAERCFIRGLK